MKSNSSERSKKNDGKESKWEWTLIYTGIVSGLVAYFSLVDNFISGISIPDKIIIVVDILMIVFIIIAILRERNVIGLRGCLETLKIDNIICAFSLFGIIGYIINKVMKYICLSNNVYLNYINLIMLITPIIITGVCIPWYRIRKHTVKTVFINVDEDTIKYFESQSNESGIPYHIIIDLYLKDCAKSGKKIDISWK